MKYTLTILSLIISACTFAQTGELKISAGVAANTALMPGMPNTPAACFGVQYMQNDHRFQYGVSVFAYQMLTRGQKTIKLANPAVPIAFVLNYKLIDKSTDVLYAGINFGAGVVFVNNTSYEDVSGESPYIDFAGIQIGYKKYISKSVGINIEYIGRESQINYTTKTNDYNYGFFQNLGTVGLIFKM